MTGRKAFSPVNVCVFIRPHPDVIFKPNKRRKAAAAVVLWHHPLRCSCAWLLFLSLPGTQSCWGEQGVCVNTRYHHHFGCFYSRVPPSARETQSVRGWRRFNICGPLSLLVLSSLSIHTLTKSIHTLTKMQTLDLVLVSLKGAVCEYVHLSPTTEGRCAFIGFISMGVFTESSQGKHGMFSKAFRV